MNDQPPSTSAPLKDRGLRKRPVQARAVDKRERILDAAQRLIHERGYPATTVALIAREARVAEATVYQMYSGREAVLYALVERASAMFDAANAEVIRSIRGRPWPELARALIVAAYQVSLAAPHLQSVSAAAQTVPALQLLALEQVRRRAEQMGLLAAEAGRLEPGPALAITARTLIFGVAETVRNALLCPPAEAEALIEEMVAVAEARWRSLGAA